MPEAESMIIHGEVGEGEEEVTNASSSSNAGVEREQSPDDWNILPIPLSVEHSQHGTLATGENHGEGSQNSSSPPEPPLNSAAATSKPKDGAASDPRAQEPPQKRRKTYSPETKRAIISAWKNGRAERMKIVAEDLQVPLKTAQSWITKFRKEGEEVVLVDRRHEGHGGAVKKMKECYVALLIEWLHYDAGMDLKQMRDYVNREILRDLMLEAHIELDENEKKRGKPLDADKATDEIRANFEQKKIWSPTTVWNNLAEHYITLRGNILCQRKPP